MDSRNYHKARKKVRRKKVFYYHVALYLGVGAFLFTINMVDSPWDIWFHYPLIAWGLAIFLHGLFSIGIPFINEESGWEKREIDREMRRLERRSGQALPRPEIQDEELELKEFRELRKEWDDQEFV